MLGRVGNDDFGRQMRQNLAGAGCGIAGLSLVDGGSGVALIYVAASGQNSIIVVPGANGRFSASDVQADLAKLNDVGIVLLQLENPLPTVLAAAREARRPRGVVILAPSPTAAFPPPMCRRTSPN